MLDTAVDQATTMIERARGHPIQALEALAASRPGDDPLLRAAVRIRSSLVVTDNAVAVHRDRLHALTRPGAVPAIYDLERITSSATDLRVAEAESRAALQSIGHVIAAREAATATDRPSSARLAQVAIARSGHAPRGLGPTADHPAPSSAAVPFQAGTGQRR